MRTALLATLLAALLLSAAAAAAAGGATLRADATRFRLTLADRRVLHSAELVGAELHSSDGRSRLRLDAVAAAADARGQPLWLHQLSLRDTAGAWAPLCAPHTDGTRGAILVPGREHSDGTVADDDSRYVIACTSAAQGKCLRAGYRPWLTGQRALFNACIRMLRADYGGDGRSHTEAGRVIDLYDVAAIQRPEMRRGQRFEAGWSEHGAVCVRHVRVATQASLARLQRRYPRLRGRVGAICTEAFARAHGALLFNRSDRPRQRRPRRVLSSSE